MTGPGGTDILPGGFTYLQGPTITAITPNQGLVGGGTAVTITGTDFVGGTTVTIGGNELLNLNIVSTTAITGDTPTGIAGGFLRLTT